MKNLLLFIIILNVNFFTAQKPALDFKAYDTWKRIEKEQISESGQIATYELTVLKGNPILHIDYIAAQKHDSISRGNNAIIAKDEGFVAWLMSPDYDTLRQLELRKVEKRKWPKDSLYIYHIEKDTLFKFEKVKQVIQAQNAPILAFTQEISSSKQKQTELKKWHKLFFWKKHNPSENLNPYKTDGNRLNIFQSDQNSLLFLDSVTQFSLSPDGNKVAIIKHRKVKLDTFQVSIYQTKDLQLLQEFDAQTLISDLNWSKNSELISFLYSTDTSKVKNMQLLLFSFSELKSTNFGDSTDFELSSDGRYQAISKGRKPMFSNDNNLLFFSVVPREFDFQDTLLEREKVNLDIWHYRDLQLQPQQLLRKDYDLTKGLIYVYHIENDRLVKIETDSLRIMVDRQIKAPYLLASNNNPYAIEAQWHAPSKSDIYRIDLLSGTALPLGKGLTFYGDLSADGRYYTYFLSEGQKWMLLDIESQEHICMNCSRKDIVWIEDLNGQPREAGPIGQLGFTKDAKEFCFQSDCDIWTYDISNKTLKSLSNEVATKNQIELRFIKFHSDSVWLDFNDGYFIGLNKANKNEHLYLYQSNELMKKLDVSQRIVALQKADKNDAYLLRKMDVSTYPDIWLVQDQNFNLAKKISTANPQQNQYNWATVETVKWNAYNGQELEGLLYKPENFDPKSTYPLLFYYYELNADNLHNYQAPKPSASIINPTEYASGGYLVFVPDIRYEPGKPAQGAYNSIMSATDYLIENYPIDENRIGLQGQSWGGYQTAMLITMTTRFTAAMAGAPVSNMFSAYGGIRWGSGLNRQFQYESTQSRIGANIWENPELYIENSPLFHLPKVQTPLLIMANDKDGAVPWYQGIELYNGLRRLGKACWMLNYNNDDHNLTKLPNKYDLSIRMRQFFDHYLLDAPAPSWMTQGRPAVKKDKELGYE